MYETFDPHTANHGCKPPIMENPLSSCSSSSRLHLNLRGTGLNLTISNLLPSLNLSTSLSLRRLEHFRNKNRQPMRLPCCKSSTLRHGCSVLPPRTVYQRRPLQTWLFVNAGNPRISPLVQKSVTHHARQLLLSSKPREDHCSLDMWQKSNASTCPNFLGQSPYLYHSDYSR